MAVSSRSIQTLLPHVAARCAKWIRNCQARDVDILVYSTYRDAEAQNALYAIGRTQPGRIVTNARGNQSWHQARRAWDAVPMVHGKPDWSYADLNNDKVPDEVWWAVMVEEAGRLGIEWAGNWVSFREFVHWQITDGLPLETAIKEAT